VNSSSSCNLHVVLCSETLQLKPYDLFYNESHLKSDRLIRVPPSKFCQYSLEIRFWNSLKN